MTATGACLHFSFSIKEIHRPLPVFIQCVIDIWRAGLHLLPNKLVKCIRNVSIMCEFHQFFVSNIMFCNILSHHIYLQIFFNNMPHSVNKEECIQMNSRI